MAHQLTQIPRGVPRSGSSKDRLVLRRLEEQRALASKNSGNSLPAISGLIPDGSKDRHHTPANDLSQLFQPDNKKLY